MICALNQEESEKVYIGTDFPDEYAHLKDTKSAKGANEKAKANAVTAIGELIEIATDKAETPDYYGKHGNKAKYGWYRYNTRFGIPVYNESGSLDRYYIFRSRIEDVEEYLKRYQERGCLIWYKTVKNYTNCRIRNGRLII